MCVHAKRQAEKKREEEVKAKLKALEDERASKVAAMAESQRKAAEALISTQGAVSKGLNKQCAGNVVKGAESGLKMEEKRIQMYKQVVGKDVALEMDSTKENRSDGMQIARRTKTITGTKENVRFGKLVTFKTLIGMSLKKGFEIGGLSVIVIIAKRSSDDLAQVNIRKSHEVLHVFVIFNP